MSEEGKLIKVGYSVEVFGYDRKNFLWEVVDYHFAEEENVHDDIGLWGFDFYLFGEYQRGVGIEGLSSYLLLIHFHAAIVTLVNLV